MNKEIRELLDRYQSGRATPQEKGLVENWYELEHNRLELDKAEEAQIYGQLAARVESFLPDRVVKVKLHPFRRLAQVAAVLFMFSSLAWTVYHFSGRPTPGAEVTYHKTSTSFGVKKEITLPDQSVIFLNAASELSVPSNFGDKNREVILSGEAFFKIHRDPSRPFIIHSGKIETTVLGTSFNIKAYEEDKHVEISVATGKVRVDLKHENGRLTHLAGAMVHNQQLVFDKHSNSHTITSAVTDEVSSWQINRLYFENRSLKEIIRVLERQYDVSIDLPAHMNPGQYTLHFNNEPLNKVLPVLCSVSSLNFKINGNKIILTKKRQNMER